MKFPIPNTLLLLASPPLTSALLPNITATHLFPGTCQGWPGYITDPIGNLTQQFFFEPRDTSNSSLDGLRSSLFSSLTPPLSTELVANTDPTVPYDIFSCTGNGEIFDIHGGSNLVFAMDGQDQELVLSRPSDEGGVSALDPEVYTLELAGVQQDGLFLGLGNVTTWGFELVVDLEGASSDYWKMRLLGLNTSLREGESEGLVGIVAL